MREDRLSELLDRVASGSLGASEAASEILASSYLDIGFAKLDLHREHRNGVDEAVYAEGKTAVEILEIAARIFQEKGRVLVTRVAAEVAAGLQSRLPEARYYERSRLLACGSRDPGEHRLCVLAAGTSDLPVAEEAAVCAEWLGARVERHHDVGVAGLHRLFAQLDSVRSSDVVIVAAGMDGALPSVVAGLVSCPVIAVPTSVGYGASFNGLAALLTMLNSCAPGVAVVNIDNGYGAAVLAQRICESQRGRSSSVASP